MTSPQASNPPWYGSVNPFEHYDSGRTHRYVGTVFGGSYARPAHNRVSVRAAACPIPTPYVTVMRKPDELFVYGGYGAEYGSWGSQVVKLDARDLSVKWWQQLSLTRSSSQWDYCGVANVHHDGLVYSTVINQLYKLDPGTGSVLGSVVLPALSRPENTAFNGFTGLPDGTLVTKNVSRRQGCWEQGFAALTLCPDATDVPPTMLVTVDPKRLEVVDSVVAEEPSIGRATVARYQGVDYVYLVGLKKIYRYVAAAGKLSLDPNWGPVEYVEEGQAAGWAVSVIGDYVAVQTNGLPAKAPMTVWVISQADSTIRRQIQPCPDSHVSFYPCGLSVDPENRRFYSMDTGAGQLAAVQLSDSDGLSVEWQVSQRSLGFIALIGPSERRVVAASDIPDMVRWEDAYENERVIWRSALEQGRELARSRLLPKMNPGAVLSPGLDGCFYYPAARGELFELQVESTDGNGG